MGCMILASLLSVRALADDPSIGFRADNTGIFPADCRPPTEFDGVKGTNLRWKAPLPNFSNSSPIAVGKKVFVVCAPGWPAGADCAVLLCLDADTGKELWRREFDEFAMLPAEQAAEARQVRREYFRRIHLLNELMYEYRSASEPRREAIVAEASPLGVNKARFERKGWGTGSAESAVYNDRELAAKLRNLCGYKPITWAPTCLDMNMPTPVSDGQRVYVYTGRRSVHAYDLDGNCLWQVRQNDAPHNYHWPEDLAGSPILVDGLLLMYCFDHLWAYDAATGKLRYRTKSKIPYRHGMGQFVLLRLPAGGGKTESAVYLWTGDLVRVRDGHVLCRKVTLIPSASLGGDGVDRVFVQMLSASSGEARNTATMKLLFPPVDRGGALAVRFTLDGDRATAEKLWFNPSGEGYKELGAYPIYLNSRLWLTSGHMLDAETGKALASPNRRVNLWYNGGIVANGHIYGLPKSSISKGSGGASGLGKQAETALYCSVAKLTSAGLGDVRMCPVEVFPATVTEPAKRKQVISQTGRDRYQDWYGWHEAYSAPFASGNRLYVRTFDNIYCFEATGMEGK